jgi:hypothetical protein
VQGAFFTFFDGYCNNSQVYVTANFTDVCGGISTIYRAFYFDNLSSSNFICYPNPTNTELIISKIENNLDTKSSEISNATRIKKQISTKVLLYSHNTTKLVFSQYYPSSTKQIKIDTSKLPNGTYYLNIIENGEKIKEQTIIVNH